MHGQRFSTASIYFYIYIYIYINPNATMTRTPPAIVLYLELLNLPLNHIHVENRRHEPKHTPKDYATLTIA